MTGAFRALFARFLSIAAVAAFLTGGVAATPAHAIVVPWSGAGIERHRRCAERQSQ